MEGRGVDGTEIERNPIYKTWEDERKALNSRSEELRAERDQHSDQMAQDRYREAELDGFDNEYCQEKADEVIAKRDSLKQEIREIEDRIRALSPLVRQERIESHENMMAKRRSQNGHDENREKLFDYLERIASAVEKLAGIKPPKKRKAKRHA